MDLNSFTQAELHNALSVMFLGIQVSAIQINNILTGTEKFDAELSMQIVESLKSTLDAANKLLLDSYKRQGLSDEAIESRLNEVKKMFGLDS